MPAGSVTMRQVLGVLSTDTAQFTGVATGVRCGQLRCEDDHASLTDCTECLTVKCSGLAGASGGCSGCDSVGMSAVAVRAVNAAVDTLWARVSESTSTDSSEGKGHSLKADTLKLGVLTVSIIQAH